jgi:excisionase family DNA binding protein
MKLTENRLDPSSLTPDERRELETLVQATFDDERPALVGRNGVRVEIPDAVFHLLAKAVRDLREGRSIVILQDKEVLTTQAAANFLGMSRPFLVSLLEEGKIPFHHVGTHRRVMLRDLMIYTKQRDQQRRKALDTMTETIEQAGLYDQGKEDHAG